MNFFFENSGRAQLPRVDYDLRIDYKERWDLFITTNAAALNTESIAAFYIGEEPTWNGIEFKSLNEVTDLVKATFPTIPVMIIEAHPALDQLQIPERADWIGFDQYFLRDPRTDPVYQQNWTKLLAKQSNSNQKVVVVMDSHFIKPIHGDMGGLIVNEMGAIAQNYYSWAKDNENVIGMIGYHWPNGFELDNNIGARGMSEAVKRQYISIGKEISNK